MKKLLLILLCVPLIGWGQETGCISGDCENGYGIFYFPDYWGLVDEYEGEFRNGLFHGLGTYIYADGDKYIGEFQNGSFHGKGIFTYLDFETGEEYKYVGEFKDDKRNGVGTLIDSQNIIISYGIWEDTVLISDVMHPSEIGSEE